MELLLAFAPIITVLVITLFFKRVIPALIAGILVLTLINQVPLQEVGHHSWGIISNTSSLQLIGFTICLSFLSSLLTLNGNFERLINKLKQYVKTKRQALLLSFFSGLIIFFDDYANTIILGSSLKNLCKPYRISKEKLAYIVDSTAAPVASIAIISTWVGFELTEIETSIKGTIINDSSLNLLIHALPYSFYPILTLGFILTLIITNTNFGPMHKAEKSLPVSKAIPSKEDDTSGSIFFNLSPIIVTIVITSLTMIITGYFNSSAWEIYDILGAASVNLSILNGALAGVLLQLILTKEEFLKPAFNSTYKQLAEPLAIILLAWLLGELTKGLHIEKLLLPYFEYIPSIIIPVTFFILAAIISFSTGTSFATMSIMFPVVIPIVIDLDLPPEYLYASIAVVLSGAIFGDHCSPISDTTILSSAACDCDHTSHVKTQLPYAVTVGIVASICLVLTFVLELHPVVGLLFGFVMNWVIIKILGRSS